MKRTKHTKQRSSAILTGVRRSFRGPGLVKAVRHVRFALRATGVTDRILAALDTNRAQTTREIARKARTSVAIASAVLGRLCKEGRVVRQAPWLLAAPKRGRRAA